MTVTILGRGRPKNSALELKQGALPSLVRLSVTAMRHRTH